MLLEQSYQPLEARPARANDEERRAEADEGAGNHVSGVVRADEDPPDPDKDCGCEEDRSGDPVEEKNGKSDPERSARVVAWKRWIVRTVAPDVRVRMGGKRPGPMPDVADPQANFHFLLAPGRASSQTANVAIATTGTARVSATASPRPSQAW